MFYTHCFLVFIFYCLFQNVLGEQPYGPHPRIVSDNGNLIIYAADHKNVTLRTTSHGYINLNDENLVLIIKDARNAAETVKRIKTNVINPFSTSMNRINDIIDGPDGLLKRISYLEGQNSSARIPPRNSINLGPNRARQFGALLRRVRALELKMASMYNLLVMNECSSNPCKNGGGCIDIYNGYLCQCSDSWTGPTCETDVNECSKFSGTDLGCQNGATCVNKQGSYECICTPGWFGIHCNRRTQDCNSGSPQELCGHGICVSQNTGIGYKCICDQGWKTDGSSLACTVDVNECESPKPHCSVNPLVPCINVPGTFYCGSCPQGYTGNGYYCNDIDECLTFNGGCSMSPRVQCINTMGSRMCSSCPPGYFGDGVTCSYRGVCQVNNGGCHQLARCVDNPNISDNYVQCICPNGYTGSGMGPFGCSRTEIAPYISACSSNPCHYGICTSHSNNSFTCLCENGYSGVTCNVKATSCDTNPCLNGGTCSNTATGYACECTSNYTGENCNTEREVCGGLLANEIGFLQYPSNNNSNYNHKVSCSWVIKTLPDKVLNITFTKFHVEESTTCQYDWFQIHDGPNSASHLIGRFCGNELPKGGTITSTRNSVYIWFRSDSTVSNPGFALKWNSIEPVCSGSIIIESHGIIKSPGFPGNYPTNRDCTWLLLAPFGKRIQLHFFSLMIGNNQNCSNDYLEIRSGSTLLIKYCNSSQPEPLISSGSSLTIFFHSDESVTDSGFQIAYSLIEGIPGCGGTFTTNRGEISSPAHDEQYPSNLDCEYKIKLDPNFRIKILFLSFALEESLRCRFDFLEIREGGKIDSPLVGRYCGSYIPPSYSSISNELYIRFKTDAYINDGGFRIKYESLCGNVFDTPTGKIVFTRNEDAEPCTYEIKLQPQKAIKLKFTKNRGFRDSDCTFNYIEVRDGDNENSQLIGKYCGSQIPTEIISTHNYLWIRFKSIIRTFEAEYSTIDLQCGGILKDSHGVIRSPASPLKYPSNTKCTWLLNAPPGFTIQINWINFDLEYGANCDVVDYVALYENNTDTGNSSLMGKYCGKKLPPVMTSTTNVVTLIFQSDVSLNADGFSLIYSFLDDSKVCGGNYFVSTGVIQTPNYPDNYYPNKECSWVISVPHGQQIMLNVEEFELEQYLNCRSDYLEIRNGAFESSPIIGIYCGKNIPKQIPSHTNNLFLKFHSDNALNKKGFKIFWDGTTTGCGGILTSATGQIASPNYPQTYGSNAICFWKISTSAGSSLNIMFLDLHLEEHLLCRLDYVEIYDGLDVQSKSLGRFCSDANLQSTKTSTNKALIKFRSDISHELRGFLIKYTTICNITLTGYRGVIESLNFPNNYPKNQNCVWIISVPIGNKINISFSHFELENVMHQKSCKFDYLEVVETDEYEAANTILNKTCGSDLPPPIHTTKNKAEVRFVSDSMVHASGFRLEWVVDGCSEELTHPIGKISTPGYPYEYPHETECHWKIQVEFNSSIELKISEFGFESSTDCMYDSLQVFNGPDENAPLLSKICHNDEKSLSIVSTSNIMFVKFTSDTSYAGKGFKASYKTVPNQCGGKYSSPRGSIHSRNYPKNYKMKDDCEWLIEIHQDNIVELNLIELDMIYSTNCSNDYLKIYDGSNDQAPLLHTLCGNNKPNDTIRSSTNTLYVRMSTKSRNTAKGFLANYTTGCGMRKVVSSNGILDFADWGHWECSWTLLADTPEKHISLTITHLELLKDCDSPMLKIFDGTNDEAPLIGSYCGNKVPPMLVTKGSAMHIALSNAQVSYISATYSVLSSECGGVYTSLGGYFSSLGYPNNYPMNTECQWTINLAPGNKAQLTFQTFDLVASDNCNADYVEIREKNAHGKLIGIYCGNTIPSNVTRTESLWIQFKSSDIGTAKGFLAEYNLVHGNELFGPSGEIASPLYPKLYEDNTFWSDSSVTWRITVDFQSVILITFNDFYISWFMGDECFAIGLEIYDGYDEHAPMLASLCTLRVPDSIRTTSNVAFVRLYMTTFQYNIKFWLKWQQIRRPTVPSKNYLGNTTDCGSSDIIDISTLKNYTLESPGFPLGYAGRLNCEWIFSTIPGNHLSIDFIVVDLEASSATCMMDSVKVYSGENDKSDFKLVKTVCLSNETLSFKIHTNNLMKIVFKTDAYINKTGFQANIWEECGGSLNGPNGVIEMKNSSGIKRHSYDVFNYCEWNITVKAGRTIEIRFLEFDIKNNDDNSCEEYIMFKNGIYPDSPLLGKGKYCGPSIPNINSTTGNSLHITYSSSRRTTGIQLAYKEVSLSCGGHIVLSNLYKTTNISSPNYPDIPPPHTECTWIISGPPGESLQIDFIDRFDLTYSIDCTKAGVELRDGGTIFSHLIGVYCKDQPSTTKTTDNMLYVRFFTDVKDPKNGFSASVSIASCGGIYRGVFGKLTSPSYPAPTTYPANTVCTWQIVGPIDHYLTLTFNDFKFPYMRNCSNTNHLLVTEKLIMGNETVLGTFCGMRSLPDIRTSANIVTIQMKINLPLRAFKGFSITYNASKEACGGNLEAESGIITSPGYPVAHHFNRNCEWHITVPVGRRITIHMIDFDLDYTQHYYNQGLAFFNAKNYRSHILYMHGNDKSDIIRSSGNHMMVYFWSLSSSNHRGFKLSYESNEPTICTGDFSKDNGVITTPTANLSTYLCEWVRRPNENTQFTNRSLTLVIDAPVIGKATSYRCKHVTSSISIATENEKEYITQLCGAYTAPQIIRTPYPTTRLMITQGKYHDLMNYTITYKENPCGGILSSSSGFIASPNFPNRYPDAIDCAWLIKIEEGQAISLNFTTIDLDTSCSNDYIDIYNGPLPSSPKIGRYCGKNNPGLILSENNALWIDYHGSKDGKGKGFILNYEPITSGCGGIFHDRNRVIKSPNYPNSYPNDAECSWEVRSNEGYHIGLSFVGRFHIEESPNCTNDFIEVFDYANDEWVSLGRKCGRNQTNYFNSTTNRMRILFRTNSKLTASGFRAVWSLNCGGTYLATTTPKYLISPGYPIEYSPLLNCNYIIKAPGKYVNIVFEDFKLETGTTCKFDNVTIQRNRFTGGWFGARYRNRTNFSYSTLGLFCGTSLPPPVRRPDILIISFQTDNWVNRKGFRLRYFVDSCGGAITKEGEITSPKDITGKNTYYGSMKCIWNITAPANEIVVVRFTFFELEHHRNCQYDSISLYNGTNIDNNQRLALLCGNITNLPVIRSSGNNLLLIMKTDVSNNLKGFKANVLFMYGDKVGCGGTVNLTGTTSSKILKSPDIDGSGTYLSNLDCQWLVLAAPDESIEMTFETFHISECGNATDGQSCNCDYLQVRDGGGPLAELMSQLCGHTLPIKITSSRNQLWIRMVTDGVAASTGFKARIKRLPSICGPSVLIVTDKKQYLTSPNYPSNYPHNTRCSWTLMSSQTFTKMEIHFDNLEIQDSTIEGSCNTDKLEIADKLLSHIITEGLGQNFIFSGPRNIPTHLGVQLPTSTFTYCGTNNPPSFYSLRNEVVVTFTSDETISKKGFKLDYRITGCNHNYTGAQGRVLNEAGVTNCTFKISAPENYTLSLYFQQFFLQSYYNAQCDPYNLQVFDGVPSNDTRIAKLCGFQLPSPIFSNTNELWFKVNNNRRGVYDFIYTTTNQGKGCGGPLFNFMGKFTSPLYPSIYRKNSVCRWDISVPLGLQASLKFLIFDLGSATNINTCNTNFVELIDIDPISKTETVRSTYCAGDVPAIFQASANIMALRYSTNLNNAGSGWVAVFSSKAQSST